MSTSQSHGDNRRLANLIMNGRSVVDALLAARDQINIPPCIINSDIIANALNIRTNAV